MLSRLAAILSAPLAFVAVTVAANAQSFTLQQVMSAPFCSGLQAAPKGDDLLWIANQEGKRNIWVAEKNGGSMHRVTSDDADDGIDVGDIAWTHDGRSILYVRGGDLEFPEKPSPNPALLPRGVTQEIFMVSAKGGDGRKLADGRTPAISPNGATLAYLKDDQIWTLDLRDPAAKPAQLFHGRGDLGSLLWSPDGKYLAFTSERDDHGFVGIFSFADSSLRYLDPSTQIDRDPVWSPDSRHIAFVRIPPDTSGIDFKPRRTAQPWSLRVADVTTGTGREVWHAQEGVGSVFHGTESDQQLYWTAGDHIVFPWERDGWLHLYSVAANGGEAANLTPGNFEVDYVAFSQDRKTLVYSSNQDDIDRRHLWSVSADGGTPQQLTGGDGLEIEPALAADGTVEVLRSDARVPIRPAVVASDGALRDVAPQMIPADFPANKLVVPQQVIFSASDGLQIHGQLFLPTSAADGQKHPALVFFHGGSRRQMLLGWHYMDYYSNAYAMNQYLASLGYIVLSVNYRSGIGYGLNFREALNYGAAGASEFNDVMGAGLYLRSRADVDGAKIGAWGGSYGGFLTAMALAKASDLFAAGVDMHGVHDWVLELGNWQPNYNPNADPQAARIAWESSPLAYVKTWRSPVLLIQGDDDRNVQFANTVRLAAALRAQGTPFEEHVFPDEIHGFLLHRSWMTAYGLEADFFGRKLMGKVE
ncbi:MAG TPA: prolyl oligopeptidase family serine peptidase [Acidobacteriaceae bacterium]|jgi:dipeptidyl aminopeptidase/acylaminoacyl peptidase|nr:prolyl oligopeptidase family serine peptidase [Acidobacteriaceae bacterium]